MKATVLTRMTGTALFAVMAMSAQITAQEEHKRERFSHYRVIDLGTLGGTYSFGFGISKRGTVAGGAATVSQNGNPNQSIPQPPQTGFLWDRGLINLGTLGKPSEGLSSSASGANIHNEVALISETARMDPNGEDFLLFRHSPSMSCSHLERRQIAAAPDVRKRQQQGQQQPGLRP